MKRTHALTALLPTLVIFLPGIAHAQPGWQGSKTATVDPFGNIFGLNYPFPMRPGGFTPAGCTTWQSVTSGTAVLLSAVSGGIPATATLVDLVPTVPIVFRDDGSAPAPTGPGIPIQANTIYPYTGNLSAAQFIAASASGSVAACFYK